MDETNYIKTSRIYKLTPKSVTIGIVANRKITKVQLKITRNVYATLLQKMQNPKFGSNFPATFRVVRDTYGDGSSFADGVTFNESKRENRNDKDSQPRHA